MLSNNINELFGDTRKKSLNLVEGLNSEDLSIQSMEDASPLKWHLAHTSWFFQEFIISKTKKVNLEINQKFNKLFNSYYIQAGSILKRISRSLMSRPSVKEILDYRKQTDEIINDLIFNGEAPLDLVELGCHHEMQHQELMLTDICHAFSFNPLCPVYNKKKITINNKETKQNWIEFEGGLFDIGSNNKSFSFDCENPIHKVFINPFKLASRLITCREWISFIEDKGYVNELYWLSDGFDKAKKENWQAPEYWFKENNSWMHFTLNGVQKVDLNAPVHNISYYEADAFARWSGKRLPTEFEWEIAAKHSINGNFLETEKLQPCSDNNENLSQMWGDAWEWTSSNFSPYPGFKKKKGALGEYNGKFMVNQFVLKGGSCLTPEKQIRKTYRNFFYPHQRWQMSSLRLADDLNE